MYFLRQGFGGLHMIFYQFSTLSLVVSISGLASERLTAARKSGGNS